MYTDQKAPAEVRGQAQSLLVFFTQGIGMFFGFWIAGWRFGETMTKQEALGAAISEARGERSIGFFESFGQMLSRNLPEGLDATLLAETMAQWKEFWTLPAIMAAAIAVVFFLLFWDRTGSDAPAGPPHEPGAPEGAPV
jgi:hypothetical protein